MNAYEELETKFAEWVGWPGHYVACATGTAALHLAFEAMRLSGEVITSDFNMIAVPRAITMAGLTPVFVDCNEKLLLDTDTVCAPEVVMATHVYGRRCDMESIHSPAPPLIVIEDLAEAHGVKPHPQTDAACWSFYKNKIVAGEEGGMVAFADPDHARLARSLRCLGFTDAHDYTHEPRGHNYRLSNLHAKLVLESLLGVNGSATERREIEAWYVEFTPKEWMQPLREAVWVYDVRIPGLTYDRQDWIVRGLHGEGIQARHGFKPMTAQREFRGKALPKALKASKEVIYFPVEPGKTTRKMCEHALDVLKDLVDLGCRPAG